MPCCWTNLTLWASTILVWSGLRAIYRVAHWTYHVFLVGHLLWCASGICPWTLAVCFARQWSAVISIELFFFFVRHVCGRQLLCNTGWCAPASSCSSKPCCLLQDNATGVQSWADEWNTLFNANNSSHMVISRPSHQCFLPSISLHEEPLPLVTTTHHLGLTISSTLLM